MSTTRTSRSARPFWRAWLAGLSTIALVVMGGFVGVSAANADELSGVITEITLENPGPTQNGWEVKFGCTWELPVGAKAGDTFTLELPPELNWYSSTTFPLTTPDMTQDVAIGVVTVTPNPPTGPAVPDYVTFTLTDYVTTHAGVSGDCHFSTTYNATGPGTHTVHFDVGVDIPVDIEEGEPCTSDCGVKEATKYGWWSDPDAMILHFVMKMPATVSPVTEVTFEDFPGPGYDILCSRVEGYLGSNLDSGGYVISPFAGSYDADATPQVPAGEPATLTVNECDTTHVKMTWINVPTGSYGDLHIYAQVTDPNLLEYSNKGTITFDGETEDVGIEVENSKPGGTASGSAIHLEKWSTADDADGNPTLDGTDFPGDFDTAQKELVVDPVTGLTAPTGITFTITNIGDEALRNIVVSDVTTVGGVLLEDITCDFSRLGGPADGTTWVDGPFEPKKQFLCTATLPALPPGHVHSDTASVTANSVVSGVELSDDDPWNAIVPEQPVPDIHIEKWSPADGGTPGLDDNDFGGGDFDTLPGKTLTPGVATPITFTITNTGTESLKNVVVTDETTNGTGTIEDLSCDFSPLGGPSGVTEWIDRPFEPDASFTCTGTATDVVAGTAHTDTATVHGIGIETGEDVTDDDPWNGTAPPQQDEEFPEIHIEKWSAEDGGTPGYTNDDFGGGDFDVLPKEVVAGAVTKITFTVTNTGTEDLYNIVVSDVTTAGTASITDLSCDFSPLGGPATGTEWYEGPFIASASFTCTGTVPALPEGVLHTDLATVTGFGWFSDIEVTDDDPWNAVVPKPILPEVEEPTPPALTGTGADPSTPLLASGALLAAGLMLLALRRRRRA